MLEVSFRLTEIFLLDAAAASAAGRLFSLSILIVLVATVIIVATMAVGLVVLRVPGRGCLLAERMAPSLRTDASGDLSSRGLVACFASPLVASVTV